MNKIQFLKQMPEGVTITLEDYGDGSKRMYCDAPEGFTLDGDLSAYVYDLYPEFGDRLANAYDDFLMRFKASGSKLVLMTKEQLKEHGIEVK